MSSMPSDFPTDWTPGMDPELHPRWEEQVQYERDMMLHGAQAVRNRVITATERDRMAQLDPVRRLALDWLPKVVQFLKDDMAAQARSRGPKPVALRYLQEMDLYHACHLALRVVLNNIGRGAVSLQTTAVAIGLDLEHEQQIRMWAKEHPKLYYATQKAQERQNATNNHRKEVNIHEFNKLLKAGTFEELGTTIARWSQDTKFRVGLALMDAIVRQTGFFVVEIDREAQSTAKGAYSTPYKLTFKPELQAWFSEQLRHEEANRPSMWPTLMPAKRWQGTRNGGYYTPFVKTPPLVRFSSHSEEQQANASEEYDSLDMGQTMGAINLVQETGYRINTPVLEAANALWTGLQYECPSLPPQRERELPPRTPRMVDRKDMEREWKAKGIKPADYPSKSPELEREEKEWKHQASLTYGLNAEIVGTGRSTNMTLDIANDLQARPEFFYPHKLDFRGRAYPIPNFLQPQGNDLAKGLLTYSTSCQINATNGGDEALAIHLANQFGLDKKPYPERLDWVQANGGMFDAIAENPVDTRKLWATKGVENFQALAASIEWAAFRKEGDGFMSSLPCFVDGTCNGLQHLSAMTRDEIAGRLVNLVPSDRPQDVYGHVAEIAGEYMADDIKRGGDKADYAAWWVEVCGGAMPRSATKRQVMVLPYGGTKQSFMDYTRAWLKEERYEVFSGMDPEQLGKRVFYMAQLLWEVCNRELRGAMTLMKWLKDCGGVPAKLGQPIFWTVPTGFTVRHFYGKPKGRRVESFLSGERVQLTLQNYTEELSLEDQLRGLPPNFTHSLDASCFVGTANRLASKGVRSFGSVHDAFGSHAANMRLVNESLREAFVWVHEHDVLGMYRDACIESTSSALIIQEGVDPMDAWDKASDMIDQKAGRIRDTFGNLEIRDILKSPYFFA